MWSVLELFENCLKFARMNVLKRNHMPYTYVCVRASALRFNEQIENRFDSSVFSQLELFAFTAAMLEVLSTAVTLAAGTISCFTDQTIDVEKNPSPCLC